MLIVLLGVRTSVEMGIFGHIYLLEESGFVKNICLTVSAGQTLAMGINSHLAGVAGLYESKKRATSLSAASLEGSDPTMVDLSGGCVKPESKLGR